MAQPSLPAIRVLKDVPALRQALMFVGVAGAVAAGIAIHNWSQKPAFVALYSDLNLQDSAAVTESLRTANIPFQIDESSGGVLVPATQLHAARMKLAGAGLPRSSSMGFEMIQQEQGFGTSQFIESARYQHALETELARTIGSLQPVRAARVHLALPKPSAFTRSQDSASASVLVELHAGRQLEDSQVASIVNVVASSVSGLVPGAVTVVDQSGRLLTRHDPNSLLGVSSEQFEHARRVELDYTRRIEQILSPMLGVGRVSAQVTADLDFSVTEEARESYKPDSAAVRSEQTSEDRTRGGRGGAAQGIPGATSNQPAPATANPPLNQLAAGSAADAEQVQSRSSTRSYELDRTISHTRSPTGSIKRLSVAVLVDYRTQTDAEKKTVEHVALAKEELDKVEALVKEAVGFDAKRGDTVSVQNAPFLQPEPIVAVDLPIWQQPEVRDLARQIGGALVVLALITMVLRPAMRSLMQAPVGAGGGQIVGREVALVDSEGRMIAPDRLALSAPGGAPGGLIQSASSRSYEEKLQSARSAVAQDPKRVAQVVKTWVAQGE